MAAVEALPEAPQPHVDDDAAQQGTAATQNGGISGTVLDTNGDIIPNANLMLNGPLGERQMTTADANGSFAFTGLKAGIPYRVTVTAKNFSKWASKDIVLKPGQFLFLTDIHLRVEDETTITVYSSTEQIATQQVEMAEKQRVLGIVPNFYVVYDHDPAPMTTKLKYKLAFRTARDPIVFVGAAFLGAIDQAADTPDYQQGWAGYGQRVGANYTDSFTDIMFGGAILPSLLHQDPRYYYQGTGTTRSRMIHALSAPFICRGDNGKRQINYSSLGGDLISASISNAYYPDSNRGAGLVFQNVGVTTGARMVSTLLQEFVLRKFTPSAKNHD